MTKFKDTSIKKKIKLNRLYCELLIIAHLIFWKDTALFFSTIAMAMLFEKCLVYFQNLQVSLHKKQFAIKSNKYTSLVIVFLLLLNYGCNSPEKEELNQKTKPNILWLVAEDLGPYIPAFGDSTIQTPNLDRLAAEGIRYNQVYSISGVCSPSRAALATGMYPTRIGAHNMQIGNIPRGMENNPMVMQFIRQYMPEGLNPYEVVPPPYVKMHSEYLRALGYYCTNNAKEDYQFKPSPTSWDESSPQAHWRNRKEGQPFFAIFNFMLTHESRIWMKAKDSLWVDDDLEVPIPPYLPDTEIAKKDIRRMYSNVLEMDYQVGLLLKQLEEDGELENTIIFWYTDHGGPLTRQKRLLYDSGLNVPMIIRMPGAESAGTVNSELISFIDFLPTLLSLVDLIPPDHLDGQAFLGTHKAKQDRKYIHAAADRFDEHADMIRAVRNDRFKYLKNYQTDKGYYLPLSFREQMPIMQELLRLKEAGQLNETQSQWFRTSKPEEELFDCINDPHELNNLANDPAYDEILKELRVECDRWLKEIDDQGFTEEMELVNKFWPQGQQPKTKEPKIVSNDTGLTINSDEAGSSLGYQIITKGDTLSPQWSIYKAPIKLEPDQQLHAIAHRKGYLPSEVVVFE